MTKTTALPRLALILAGLALAGGPARPASAQERVLVVIDQTSDQGFPIAVPQLLGLDGSPDPQLAAEVHRVVLGDLRIVPAFQVMDPESFLEDPKKAGLREGEFNMEDWRVVGALGLAKCGYRKTSSGEVQVEVRVYDVEAGALVAGKVVSGTGSPRAVGHRVADVIYEAFTGQKGMFSTRIAAVGNAGGNKEVYLLDVDGQNVTPISRNGSINLSPSISRDGTRIAYTSYKDGNPDLFVADLATGRSEKVSGRSGINTGGAFSPDGGSIALTLSKDGDSEIYLLDRRGEILDRLTRAWGIDVSPSWSPDGQQLAFVSSREGTPQIFVMDRSGGNLRRLTFAGTHNVSPAWSPDGKQIAFAGRDEGRFDIFAINADGTHLRRLTQSAGDDEDPSWSPDGGFIVFSSDRDGRAKQLYIMGADGRNPVRVTDGKGSWTNPDWGPLAGR